jgi:hypothetical protein
MEVIQTKSRPLSILFVRSPDLQVTFPSTMELITPSNLLLGIIEGYVMVTGNYLHACEGEESSNCDKLLPGMVILQVSLLRCRDLL